jgi:hypothetical protein
MGLRRRLNQEALVRFAGLKDEDVVLFSDKNEVRAFSLHAVNEDKINVQVCTSIGG